MEIGIDSFAAVEMGDIESTPENSARSLDDLLVRIEHADKMGLDVFGIGEHYRKEFLDSAPHMILSAAAARTKNIILTSAVTVLSAADPVRTFQNYSTLDLLSHGRAEMVVGRGSFTESFPLFGLNLNQYDEIFSEKLDLLASENSAKIYDDVFLNYSTGTLEADIIDYNFITKHFKVSMFDDSAIKMKVIK